MSVQFQLLQIDPNLQQLGLEIGTGSVIGGLIGYAAKKVAKVIAVIIGIQLALFKLLESRGIIDVHWNKLGATFLDAGQMAPANTPPSWMMSIMSTMSVGAGFTGGFMLGYKKG